jgi:hypothetical protein
MVRASATQQNLSSMNQYLEHSSFELLAAELLNYPSISRASFLLLEGISRNLSAHSECSSMSLESFQGLLSKSHSDIELRCGDIEILPSRGEAYIFSDFEGNLKNLLRLFIREELIERLSDKKNPLHLVFLGDLIDRSKFSLPFLEFLLLLKSKYTDRIHIIAGNHELSPGVQQRIPDGFAAEIRDRRLPVDKNEWRDLLRLPFFREYIRGSTAPFEGHCWLAGDEYRYNLSTSYLAALQKQLHQEPKTAPLELSSENAYEKLASCHSLSESEVIVRTARESMGKLFLWDLSQLYFSTLPKIALSKNFIGVHGLPPCSGNFSAQDLLRGGRSGDELLFDLARACLLPSSDKDSLYEEMVWSDLWRHDCDEIIPPTFLVTENDSRGAGYKVSSEVPLLFLNVIGRPLLFRGHQRFTNPDDFNQHPIYTIDSSGKDFLGQYATVSLENKPTRASVLFKELY